jgi:hypothetical protein
MGFNCGENIFRINGRSAFEVLRPAAALVDPYDVLVVSGKFASKTTEDSASHPSSPFWGEAQARD